MRLQVISKGSLVIVSSGDDLFLGKVDEIEWDVDQWSYKINNKWYCQSEVSKARIKDSPWSMAIGSWE